MTEWKTILPSVAPPSNFAGPPLIERVHRAAFPQPAFDLGYIDPYWRPEAEAVSEPAKPEPQEPAAVESDTVSDLPPVVAPAPRDMQAEVARLMSPLAEYLDQFLIEEPGDDGFERGYHNPLDTSPPALPVASPEAEAFECRKADLSARLRAWSDQLRGFLEDHRQWSISMLTAQQEKAAAEVRAQIAVVERVVQEHNAQAAVFRSLRQERSKAHALLAACEAREPHLDNCPTRIEVARWAQEHRECTEVHEAAQSAEDVARAQLNRLVRKVTEEQTKLNSLASKEKALRARLSGEDDRELGLPKPTEL